MRLLEIQSKGELKLTKDLYGNIPDYAILSHTWAENDEDEVNFEDLKTDSWRSKPGCKKIEFCRDQASKDGLQYFWVDSCCIKKSSDTELTEAINSMFRWYARAAKCYVYLSDVSAHESIGREQDSRRQWKPAFRNSRWFTRGWTLQELIAPTSVEFYSVEGEQLCDRESMEQHISEITGVAVEALQGKPLSQFSIDERMAWVETRKTTREEDIAYSLLGIFDVNMRLSYGEGRQKAMDRLRRKINKNELPQLPIDEGAPIQFHTKEHNNLLGWISSMDFPAQHSDFIARKQDNTGQWFPDAPEFGQWLDNPKESLFCPGIPGAGKTMIAAIAIDHLLNTRFTDTVGVAYVYCNYKAQAEQDTVNLLAAILKQLVQVQPSFTKPVKLLYDHHASRRTKPSLEEIFKALESVLAKYSSVYIIVDALDECRDNDGTRHKLLEKLRGLQRKADLRLMVTSRYIPDIMDEFSEALTLEVRASDEDVKHFVAGQIYRLPNCVRRDNALKVTVQDKIAKAADGMFLLARLLIDSLLDKRTKSRVQSTLETLSSGTEALNTAYGDAIERIKSQLPGDSALAKTALSWIIFAKRALTTEEICHALAVQPKQESLDPDNILDVEDIVAVCAGLVTVDKETDIIRLVHFTAQTYFEEIRDQWNPHAQLDIASTCLTYLSFSVFREGACPTDQDFESRLKHNSFLSYAARYWSQHIVTVQKELYELGCGFLGDDNLVSCAVQAMSVPQVMSAPYRIYAPEYSQQYPKRIGGLHLTAEFGLAGLAKEILSRSKKDIKASINTRNGFGETPLLLASREGHEAMVQLLLDQGAGVNERGGFFGTALQVASRYGHEAIVQRLLDQGADVNARGGLFGSALRVALANGHEAIAKRLLDRGADINSPTAGKTYGTALQAALLNGYEEIAKQLLDQGADFNAPGGKIFGTALQVASLNGLEAIVRRLLDQGADINAPGGEKYGTALQAASVNGHEAIVKLLLDRGADINATGGEEYGTALQAASTNGHEGITRLLLDRGADINATGTVSNTALRQASAKGHEAIVRLLLDKGADINAQEGSDTALQAASAKGHEAIV